MKIVYSVRNLNGPIGPRGYAVGGFEGPVMLKPEGIMLKL